MTICNMTFRPRINEDISFQSLPRVIFSECRRFLSPPTPPCALAAIKNIATIYTYILSEFDNNKEAAKSQGFIRFAYKSVCQKHIPIKKKSPISSIQMLIFLINIFLTLAVCVRCNSHKNR